ncbi:MAG: Calx-beta domain-containing protein, partial [Planctomycetota bacterium]
GFYVHDMPRAGLRSVSNDGAILRNNKSDHNSKWGILTGWSDNIVVESNEVSRSQIEHGIYISNSSDGAVIRDNVVWGNRDSGIQFNADRRQSGDGIQSNNLVEGNVIYGNGVGGGAALNFDGLQDSVIRNNLLYDNHAGGIVLYVSDAADGSKNNVVANNTVIQAADGRWALLMANGSGGNVVMNNILLSQNPGRGSLTVDSNSLPAMSDHNVVSSLYQLNGYNASFSQWHSLSGGQDANSIVIPQANVSTVMQALFVNPANNDFHLKAGSVAIDAGDSVNAPATDVYGHSRPSGVGVDIGAFEAGQFATTVQFQSADWVAYEQSGLAEITIARVGDTEGLLAVDVFTSVGTATLGGDYQALATQLVFHPGEASKTFFVLIKDDSEIESLETVGLCLVVANNQGPQPQTGSAILHIQSDDVWVPGAFQFANSEIAANEAEGVATITVHRAGGSSGAATVEYTTANWVKPRTATWIKRQTELLYPTDNDTPATAGVDYAVQSGVLTFADGETEKTFTVSLVNEGWYEGGEAFTVALSNPTGNTVLGAKSNLKVHIDSDDIKQAGAFVWSNANYTVIEGTPAINLTVNRINGGNVDASVRLYDTGAGNGTTTASAWAPSDYAFPPSVLYFAPGEMSKTVSIPIVDDLFTEIDECFSITLSGATNGAAIGSLNTAVVTIQDNESSLSFQFPNGQWSYSQMENAGAVAVTVMRQGSLVGSASARVATIGSTATAGVDFTAVDVTVSFAPGESAKLVYVPVINDSMVEPTETFVVTMSGVVGATQGVSSASVNILNDDVAASPGKLQLSAATYSVSEAGGAVSITVTRLDGADGTVSVQYSTSDGDTGNANTAWAGSDYTSKSGTLVFAPGETSKTISVPITNDTQVEKDEVFTISLKNASGGAVLGTTAKAVVTIIEDDSSIDLAQTSYAVNESAGVIQIKLRRNGSATGTAMVDLNISSGTAIAGIDFIKPGNKTVNFADGEYEKLVDIAIIDDVLHEADETFSFSLANAVNSKLGNYLYGSAKILAND